MANDFEKDSDLFDGVVDDFAAQGVEELELMLSQPDSPEVLESLMREPIDNLRLRPPHWQSLLHGNVELGMLDIARPPGSPAFEQQIPAAERFDA